jgi:tetratricopeptide (TPR) repeat protein
VSDLAQVFVGREPELNALGAALTDAEAGMGSVWLVSGEAGIGKTRLVEELGRLAESRGFLSAWGSAWESGGAPPFFTWARVLRAIRRRRGGTSGDRAIDQVLAQILPEFGGADAAEATATSSDQARFRLLDAVVTALLDASEAGPIVIVLEDLHAADLSSLLLLELLSGEAKNARLIVLGTLRDSQDGRVADVVARIGRNARTLSLTRLDTAAVARYLTLALPDSDARRVAPSIQAASEGNPLFMVELTRWLLASRRELSHATMAALPSSIKSVLDARLATVAPEALATLRAAAVLGREFSLATLERVARANRTALHTELTLAGSAVEPLDEDRFRFSHVLLRDALYDSIPRERRMELHRLAADACLSCAEGKPSWSEPAHHLLLAGDGCRERAIEAARCAGEQALGQLAFDEAVGWFERALAELGRLREIPALGRYELLLALGRARLLNGDIDGGRALCAEAADIARSSGAPKLLARAALDYGSVFLYAQVSDTLVGLLQEALASLPPDESRLRVRVMARLAAAQQPAPDPRGPFTLAHRAVALARSEGDAAVLLEVLASAGSALADLAPPGERAPLDREHLALAERLGDANETLRAALRVMLDAFELADLSSLEGALSVIQRSAERIASPHALWRAALAQAMAHTFRGRFELAREEAARAARFADHARDPNAPAILSFQRLLTHDVLGDDAAVLAAAPGLRATFAKGRLDHLLLDLLERVAQVRSGRLREPCAADPHAVETFFALGDPSGLALLSEVALVTRDLRLCERVYQRLRSEESTRCFVSWGLVAFFAGGPWALYVARLASALGLTRDAEAAFDQALAATEAAGAAPYGVWTRLHLARHLGSLADATGRRDELLDTALREARALGMSKLARAVELERGRFESVPPDPSPAMERAAARGVVPALSVRRLGDVWEVAGEGVIVHLPATRGLDMLSRLLAEPGRSFHVLELVGEAAAEAGVAFAPSDAGPLIDEEARDAYRKRLAELADELAEAEAWNDAGRVERLRTEHEAVSQELARGVGLGGRLRRAGSATERARVNVQRRLKDVTRRLSAQAPALGALLERGLQTGIHCRYDPRSDSR